MENGILAKVTLSHPLVHGSETYKVLEFRRRLKARDFFGIKIGSMRFDDYLTILSRAVNIPTHILEDLDAEDFQKAAVIVDGFLSSGPTTPGSV